MEEQQDPKLKLEQLEARKRELLDRIRKVNGAMRDGIGTAVVSGLILFGLDSAQGEAVVYGGTGR